MLVVAIPPVKNAAWWRVWERRLESGNNYYVGIVQRLRQRRRLHHRKPGHRQRADLPANSLDYAAGSSATISNLAPREARYDKVTIEPGTPSWEFT